MLEIKWSEGFNCKVISYTNHTFYQILVLTLLPCMLSASQIQDSLNCNIFFD